jgi:lipoate-protein ligase A
LLGAGCLLFSLVLPLDRALGFADLQASYRIILERIQLGLAAHAAPILLQGSSDLTFAGRKFSGNAQQRKRTHFLHHGSLLYDFDFAPIEHYLKLPPRQPAYRQGRGHADFLCNLPIRGEELRAIVRAAWPTKGALTEISSDMVRQLVREKYQTAEWTYRR